MVFAGYLAWATASAASPGRSMARAQSRASVRVFIWSSLLVSSGVDRRPWPSTVCLGVRELGQVLLGVLAEERRRRGEAYTSTIRSRIHPRPTRTARRSRGYGRQSGRARHPRWTDHGFLLVTSPGADPSPLAIAPIA